MENNVKSIATVIITAVIMVAIIGAILIPICNGAAHAGATEKENGTNYVDLLADGETAEIIVSNTNVTYSNGDRIDGYGFSAIVSDALIVAINNGGINIFYDGGWGAIKGANIAIDGTAKTITLSDITYSGSTTGDATRTFTYGAFCAYRTANDLGYCTISYTNISTVTVNNSAQIYAVGYSGGSNGGMTAWAEDKVYVSSVLKAGVETGITLADTAEAELKTVSAITYNGVSATAVVVPSAVYGTADITDSEANLISLIPLLVLVGLALAVVGSLIARRD